MKAKIFYLKNSAVKEYGFGAEPAFNLLKDSADNAFEHVGTYEFESDKPYEFIADQFFERYNTDENPLATPEGQEFLGEIGADHTSMSIGDYIEFDDHVALIVDGVGFKELVL